MGQKPFGPLLIIIMNDPHKILCKIAYMRDVDRGTKIGILNTWCTAATK